MRRNQARLELVPRPISVLQVLTPPLDARVAEAEVVDQPLYAWTAPAPRGRTTPDSDARTPSAPSSTSPSFRDEEWPVGRARASTPKHLRMESRRHDPPSAPGTHRRTPVSAFLFLRPANVLVDAPEPPRHTSRDPRGAPTSSGRERAAIVLQRGSLLLRVGLLAPSLPSIWSDSRICSNGTPASSLTARTSASRPSNRQKTVSSSRTRIEPRKRSSCPAYETRQRLAVPAPSRR
jgi:hypothetical protein